MCGRFCDTSRLCVHLTSGSFLFTLKRTVSECSKHAWAIMPIKTVKQNISSIGLGLLAELMLFSQVFAAALPKTVNLTKINQTVNLTKNRVAVHFLFFSIRPRSSYQVRSQNSLNLPPCDL